MFSVMRNHQDQGYGGNFPLWKNSVSFERSVCLNASVRSAATETSVSRNLIEVL